MSQSIDESLCLETLQFLNFALYIGWNFAYFPIKTTRFL